MGLSDGVNTVRVELRAFKATSPGHRLKEHSNVVGSFGLEDLVFFTLHRTHFHPTRVHDEAVLGQAEFVEGWVEGEGAETGETNFFHAEVDGGFGHETGFGL